MHFPGLQKPTHIISLGSTCEVTYNLRRNFRMAGSYPFDWIGSPLNWLTLVLETGDPELVLSSSITETRIENMPRTPEGDWISQINPEGGHDVVLAHVFDRYGGFHPKWIAPARELLMALYEALFDLNGPENRILFVRKRYHGDFPLQAQWWPRLIAALEKRFDQALWDIIVTGTFVPEAPAPEGSRSFVYYGSGPDWRGNILWWDRACTRFGIEYMGEQSFEPIPERPFNET